MLIDWFTVGAQIRQLLDPGGFIKEIPLWPDDPGHELEAKIKDQLAEAESRQQAATAEEAAVHQRLQELEDKRQALAAQVKAEVEDRKRPFWKKPGRKSDKIAKAGCKPWNVRKRPWRNP